MTTIKVMSYNIRSGYGMDDVQDLERIASVIAAEQPDLVALNEVDQVTERSKGMDQAAQLAELLGYHHVFGPAIAYQGGHYGNALLSKQWITASHNQQLPIHPEATDEPRALLHGTVELASGEQLEVLVTHLGLAAEERALSLPFIADYAQALVPVVLLGDFNIRQHNQYGEMSPLHPVLRDTATLTGQAGSEALYSFPADEPAITIDYIWVSEGVQTESLRVIHTEASDHLPLVAELKL